MKTKPHPPYVFQYARSIHAIGGTVWHTEKTEFGFLIRATVGGKTIRVVFPPLYGKGSDIPHEPNSVLHIATSNSFDDFQQFLNQFSRP